MCAVDKCECLEFGAQVPPPAPRTDLGLAHTPWVRPSGGTIVIDPDVLDEHCPVSIPHPAHPWNLADGRISSADTSPDITVLTCPGIRGEPLEIAEGLAVLLKDAGLPDPGDGESARRVVDTALAEAEARRDRAFPQPDPITPSRPDEQEVVVQEIADPAEEDIFPTMERLIEAGKTSPVSRTVQLAEQLEARIQQLRERLGEEARDTFRAHERAAKQAEFDAAMASLERQMIDLTALRAAWEAEIGGPQGKTSIAKPAKKTTGKRGDTTVRTPGAFPCPEPYCTKLPMDSPQALGSHRARTHGYRKGDDG
jgi:hypothetical protein